MSYDVTPVNVAIVDLRDQTHNMLRGLERAVTSAYAAIAALHEGSVEDSQHNLYAVETARTQAYELLKEAMDKTFRAAQAVEGLRR